ncbi:glycosyltransferase family 2 protein [Chitinophaga sp. XS-30]|uniref:glycosyltransferase family 2 protein n=1 Tax=Chitinophaga sp. XS-30 TaxID=2604421 RepID=UPI0011DDCA02|nr:glycosyltransferase family 2 protein [Chitinophaga sp. XS-30]QEH39754.1 glycosyltransferase family 2 protein [Chitinophaga sp. XS-30]
MLLSILIPTYNRQKFLLKNLEILCAIITENNLNNDVEIIISNNCSPDSTSQKVRIFMEMYPDIKITFFDQPQNIGLEANALLVLSESHSEYAMYLGDDDYLTKEYLVQLVKRIKVCRDISCIIPSYQNINPEGNHINDGRDIGLKSQVYSGGFENCLENSFRGHQLSGLTFKQEGLLDTYRKNAVQNMYPFIYFVSRCCLDGKTWHFTDYPVLVTAAPQKDKDWGYGNDGLLANIFDNYKKLEGINTIQRSKLELRFLFRQHWRYDMYLSKGKLIFANVVLNIIKSRNTSWPTKIIFPGYITYRMVRKIVRKCLP